MVVAQALRRAPWWSIALVTGMVAALAIPGAAEYLVYDRGALARGELWRVFSAHIVHYSGAHLLANVLVLLPAAMLVEVRYRVDFPRVLAVSAVAIGVGLFFFKADIYRYAGASGVSLALLTYALLRGLNESRRWRFVCAILLALVVTKLAAEGLFNWQVADWERDAGFVTVTLSHAIGAGTALAIWVVRAAKRVQVSGIRTNSVLD